MPNSTCRLLSNGYKFNIDWDSSISYRPCCHFPKSQKLAALESEHREFRQQLNAINSYESDTCANCNFQENSKLRKTFRNHSFDWVPEDADLGDACYLEIQTDNTCNGGCIICGPWHSSYWQSELKQFSIKPAQDPIDKILSFIDIQKTRKILFLGGEPFLTDADTRVLSMIKHPELVDVNYTTNGSIYPSDNRIKLWSQLKSVWINFSIDGINDRFDYIRYPLKWSQVEKNIVRMLNELPENVRFKSNHTVNMLNLYYYDEFKHWHSRVMTSSKRLFDFTFNPCSGTLSPRQVPGKLFDMLLDKYGKDSKVIRTIDDNNQNDQTELLTYLSELDTRRGLDWRQVFPEISNCIG
jgi:organic radical activating enzyme